MQYLHPDQMVETETEGAGTQMQDQSELSIKLTNLSHTEVSILEDESLVHQDNQSKLDKEDNSTELKGATLDHESETIKKAIESTREDETSKLGEIVKNPEMREREKFRAADLGDFNLMLLDSIYDAFEDNPQKADQIIQ